MMSMNSVFPRRLWSEEVEGFDLRRSQGGDEEEAHVLAVDDSLVDRKVIERLLKFYSCKVTAVDSGRRALQFLGLDEEVEDKSSVVEGLKVDLIITDYCMPGMTGYELLKKIKESAAFRETPVVIMSSENVLARIDRCLEEGAEDFIVKPVKLSDLERLKEHLMARDNDSNYRGKPHTHSNKRKQPDGPDLSDSTNSSESSSPSPSPSPPPSSRSSPETPNMEDANPQASSEASKELPAKVASPFGVSSTGSDRTKAMIAGNIPMMFGYPHGQLPSLDSDSTWGMVTRHPLLHPYSGRPLSASATNHGQSEGEHPAAAKEGSSSRAEDSVKTSNVSVVFRAKPEAETHKENSFPSEYPSIRPGTAADLKFGGAGSLPNLPWVSTTGPGPNGRTISGVTYRFSANEIKIVCACHGLHMSPEDFIQHASDEPPSAAGSTAVAATTGALASFPGTSNVAASATS